MSKPQYLIEFTAPIEREVNETNTRVEDGKTITETVKVKRVINVPFALKKPSRAQREDAELERAVWEHKYLAAGVQPAALLHKIYANQGGVFTNEQLERRKRLQADFLLAETELRRLQTTDKDNKEAIDAAALKFVSVRQDLIDIQQWESAFYSGTAEAKAREKLIEWYVLHLTYFKPTQPDGSNGEYVPFFAGETTAAKLASFDAIIEARDEMWAKARDTLEMIAVAYVSGGEEDAFAMAQMTQENEAAA